MRTIFNLPPRTHTYFIEEISGCRHIQVTLWSRFVQFHKSLTESKKPVVRFLSSLCINDQKTVHGSNLFKMMNTLDCELEELSSNYIKSNMFYKETSQEDEWRIPLLQNLLEIRNQTMELFGFEKDEINSMIEDICTN